MSKSNNSERPLLVTTSHKGVFFGYGQMTTGSEITITRARMCIYWDSACRGVFGLAAKGPTKDCRIGPQVPEITLRGVTAVAVVADEAVDAWEKAPWK